VDTASTPRLGNVLALIEPLTLELEARYASELQQLVLPARAGFCREEQSEPTSSQVYLRWSVPRATVIAETTEGTTTMLETTGWNLGGVWVVAQCQVITTPTRHEPVSSRARDRFPNLFFQRRAVQ